MGILVHIGILIDCHIIIVFYGTKRLSYLCVSQPLLLWLYHYKSTASKLP